MLNSIWVSQEQMWRMTEGGTSANAEVFCLFGLSYFSFTGNDLLCLNPIPIKCQDHCHREA